MFDRIRWLHPSVTPLLAVFLFLAGCGPGTPSVDPSVRLNVVTIDRDGQPRNPVKVNDPPLTAAQYEKHIDELLSTMDQFHSAHAKKRILIFVHGGLNDVNSSLLSAADEVHRIETDPQIEGTFPIFINWNSGLWDSYGEHLFKVTQGRKERDHKALRAMLSPLYLFADLGRAVTRIPVVWTNQIGSDLAAGEADLSALTEHEPDRANPAARKTVDRWVQLQPNHQTAETFAYLNRRYAEDLDMLQRGTRSQAHAIRISIGDDNAVDPKHLAGLAVMYAVTSPVKFSTSWVIDGFGKASWENMSRRTEILFEGTAGADPRSRKVSSSLLQKAHQAETRPSQLEGVGALQVFMNRLARHIERLDGKEDNPDYEITLVGHSMGTMVLNEWVRRESLKSHQYKLYYKVIVYMAAACSVRDFETSVLPYLLQQRDQPDGVHKPKSLFYNLTLHPTADLRERRRGGDLPPRGSLLLWIDDFLAEPQTPLDRTLGRWDNIVEAAHILPDAVKGQITIKAGSLELNNNDATPGTEDDLPQNHGGFRVKRYWRPSFWEAAPPRRPEDPLLLKAQQVGVK